MSQGQGQDKAIVLDARGQLHPKIIKEEHVSVTWEPHGRYLTHFTPEPAVHPDKSAKKVAEVLYDVLVKHNAQLEKRLGHKCHWSVCLCHTNELSLKATTLRNMITWKVKEAHEPVLTCKVTREQLEELLIKPSDDPKFSNHTQSTERCVKQFTEAAAAVVGQDRRCCKGQAAQQGRDSCVQNKETDTCNLLDCTDICTLCLF